MQNRILNILSWLSQCLLRNKDLFYDSQEIWEELARQGFSEEDIELALGHLQKMFLNLPGPFWADAYPVYRAYTDFEMAKLNPRVRGYLWRLKCQGIIDHALEDEIVQKAMNLDEPAGLKEIKTVAALTVFGYEHRFQVDQSSRHPFSNPQLN